jgi:hypothetical protein
MNNDLTELETTVQGMDWKNVSLEPSPEEVQALDRTLPDGWTQTLEQEAEFSQEELQALLDAPLDGPEGDIDENARQAISELDIDVQEIMQELDHEPTMDIPEREISHDDDFGR